MLEAAFKQALVAAVKKGGGYARRIEDQYAVGVPDMVLAIRRSAHVLMVEAKIAKGTFFAPSPRQLLELERINTCGNLFIRGYVVAFSDRTGAYHCAAPAARIPLEGLQPYEDLPALIEHMRTL